MRYTKEQIEFLRANYGKVSNAAITDLFNKRFNAFCSTRAIKQALHNHGITISQIISPISAEKTDKHGYTQIKVCSGCKKNNWKYKHRLIWEQANGPIPGGYRVIFLDKNKSYFSLDNLALATRGETAYMNRNNLFFNDAERTEAGLTIARLSISSHKRLYQLIGENEYKKYMKKKDKKNRTGKDFGRRNVGRKEHTERENINKQEYIDYLRTIADRNMKDIKIIFNAKFGMNLNERQLYMIFAKNNIPKRQPNKSGYKGVIRRKNRWEARIKYKGKFIYVGTYNTAEEASAERTKKEQELRG